VDFADRKSFFWRLTEETARRSGRESFVTSPICVELGLAMVYMAAEGASREELGTVLGLRGREEARRKYRGWTEALRVPWIRWGHALFLSQDVEVEENFEKEVWETFRYP
jgi:serine protease inhibitor